EILGKPFKIHKKYFSLFFKNNENPKKTLIIKDGHPDDVMTNIINKIEQNGKNLFDFSKDVQEENKKLFEQKNIYEYSQIDNLTNGTQLSTYEHPKFFEYAFKYSKKEVVIISPWIRWEIIKEKKDAIENALKRKVEITFFYGMGKKDDLDKKSKEFFIDMQKKYPNLLKFSTNNDINDHSKIIICDRDWMVTTSFNWTSFKGDENREERKERGSFINDRSEVLKIIEVYIK
ncbi:MAG: phospholipase D-like domain-containing protein, partial [Poseidonibacter sp.]|uniref:phospholipase D-like domain-containing protein n=1 Tax=Poseidonibacter sp. TaxID=2321188 RepID=UPI00359D1A75